MNIPVRFRYSGAPERPASAWFIEGNASAEWLAELLAWDRPHADARLLIVPTSPLDPTPCGLLVTGLGSTGHQAASHVSPRTRPYGLAHRRLYLPIEAAWEPQLAGAELESLLDDEDSTYVWHPRAGLVRFAPGAALRVSDLLVAPPPCTERWDRAVPGLALSTKLTSLEPEFTPTAEQVLDDARGDIATEKPRAELMPPTPNEAKPGLLGAAGRAAERGLAGSLKWFTQQLPRNDKAANWVNALEQWAEARLRRISQSLDAARNRELHRLMNLLQNDPDEGLRFALPMGGGESRGIAPPSDRLGRRDVDFRLGGLGGGGPADVWNMPFDLQRQLTQRYRELAAREIALGRHRRAAYIFAELLNDLPTAAVTLEDGRHYREAAALYDGKLKRPLEAARCLRRGGLRTEAIALYDRLGEHELVGDLYAELEQSDDAQAAWRRAVAVKLKADDVLAAATLLEAKLADVEEAYARLVAAWPHTKQAQLCLTAAFALSARTERHDQAAALVDQLPTLPRPSPETVATLVELLGKQALEYPSDAVRSRALDQTRLVAAERLTLPTLDVDEVQRLTRVVGSLVPNDRLLSRDAQRFAEQRRKKPVRAAAASSRERLRLAHEVRLQRSVVWQTAVATDDAIYAAGFFDRELIVVRTDWSGAAPEEAVGRSWRFDLGAVERRIALAIEPTGGERLFVHVCGAEPVPSNRYFRANDRFPDAVEVGPHRGFSAGTYGLHSSERGALHVVQDGGESLLVQFHSSETQPGLTGLVALDLLNLPAGIEGCRMPLPIAAGTGGIFLGVGANLCRLRAPGYDNDIVPTPSPITHFVASAKGARPRLVVGMETGGLMIWDDDFSGRFTTFADDMLEPRCALTRDGSLVAAGHGKLEVYSSVDRRLKLSGQLAVQGLSACAAVARRQVNRFALLSTDGALRIYDLIG